MASTDIIIHDKKDNVGVVVIEKVAPNQTCNCWIMEGDGSTTVEAKNEVPLGHKLALVDLNEGDTIIKYGHCLLYTSPSPRDISGSRMPSSA